MKKTGLKVVFTILLVPVLLGILIVLTCRGKECKKNEE